MRIEELLHAAMVGNSRSEAESGMISGPGALSTPGPRPNLIDRNDMTDSTSPVKAIQTRYAGCHFRSRLEARWAVFFDTLGIKWEYEPQGFHHEMHDVDYEWLPDFYLPTTETWVEVKGSDAQLRADWHRLLCMLDWGSPVPGMNESDGTDRGVLLLGPIPRVDLADVHPIHPIAQHHKGVFLYAWSFFERPNGGLTYGRSRAADLHSQAIEWQTDDRQMRNYFDSSWGSEHCFSLDDTMDAPSRLTVGDHFVLRAYKAARSARFEHGQSGA